MSWSIGETVNTVRISPACAKELFKADDDANSDIWDLFENVTCRGKLTFNSDHQEWMDYLGSHEKLVEILKKHKVAGDICFGSLEGDNAGEFWGYRFDGKGGMVKLTGQIVYEENHTPLKGMTFVLTGALSKMTRREAYEKIHELGGAVAGAVSKNVTHLVAGEKPGSKLDKALRTLGISILDEEKFLALFGR